MKTTERRESHSGFHFYNLYEHCRRKFFIKYVMGIDPLYTSPPLILGAAFHEGKGEFYLTGSKDKALLKTSEEIKSRKNEFFSDEDYIKVLTRTPIMLASWIDKHGYNDLELYNIISVEQFIEASLPHTNYRVTMRLDAILQHKKSMNYFIRETKSTQSSIDNMRTQVNLGDQATVYIWGFRKAYPDKPLVGVIPDITFWHKSTIKEENIRHSLSSGDLVVRSKADLLQWEEGMSDLITEISQRVSAYYTGNFSEYSLFKRNTYWCNSYFKPCEYSTICRGCDLSTAPDGFKKREFQLNFMEEI